MDHLVLLCADGCGTLIDQHTVQAVTNAGEMPAQKGRLVFAVVSSEKFFRMEAVFLKKPPDPSNGEGSVPLQWLSAVYLDPAQRLLRFRR